MVRIREGEKVKTEVLIKLGTLQERKVKSMKKKKVGMNRVSKLSYTHPSFARGILQSMHGVRDQSGRLHKNRKGTRNEKQTGEA